MKRTLSVNDPTAVEKTVREWASFMDVTTPFEVQVGSFDTLPEWVKGTGDEFAATFGNADNSEFIIAISDKCPPERLEQVIVHELVHVHTFAQSSGDPHDIMETATELAAQLVMRNRIDSDEDYEHPLGCECGGFDRNGSHSAGEYVGYCVQRVS